MAAHPAVPRDFRVELSVGVTLPVLGAALLHATWNAMVKSSSDKLLDTALVCIGGAAVTMPFLFVVQVPPPSTWPYLAASLVIHVAYFFAIVGAYRAGDLSHGYPIMRGTAPLLVAVAALVLFDESVSAQAWFGIALISGGVLSLGIVGVTSRAAIAWALANGAIIALYTLVDAAGARLSGDVAAYVVWMFVLDSVPFGLIVLAIRGGELLRYLAQNPWRGVAGGVCSSGAYAIAIWAMTLAPVAMVAALRESSVIFAALIGAWLLKEGHIRLRLAGAAVVVAGIVALKI